MTMIINHTNIYLIELEYAIKALSHKPSLIKFFLSRTDLNEEIIIEVIINNLSTFKVVKEYRPELLTKHVIDNIKAHLFTKIKVQIFRNEKIDTFKYLYSKEFKDRMHFYKINIGDELFESVTEELKKEFEDMFNIYDILE